MSDLKWKSLISLSGADNDPAFLRDMRVSHAWLDMDVAADREQALALLTSYDKRRSIYNYTRENIQRLIGEKRFDGGVFVGLINNQPINCFGVTKLRQWYVITRFAKLRTRIPHLTGYGIDVVLQRARSEQMQGVMMTLNDHNSLLRTKILTGTEHFNRRSDGVKSHPLWLRHEEMITMIRELPDPVFYHGVYQNILYISLDGSQPQFD